MPSLKRINKIKKRISIIIQKNLLNDVIKENDLLNDLETSGLEKGDIVMVHSSLSRIGILSDGANTVVNSLKNYIGKEGLLVMPSFIGSSMLNYLDNYLIWDVNNSPSYNGAITELFRKSEGAVRSLHPTHSLVAWGKNAHDFCAGHEKSQTPFDKYSPYRKLIEENFNIFFIGLDLFSMTLCRGGDDFIENYPDNPYLDKIFKVPILDYNGNEIIVSTKCHAPAMSERRRNMFLFPLLKEKIQVGKFGRTHTLLVNATDVINAQKELARNGKTVYGSPEDFKSFCSIIEDFKAFIR